MKFSVICATAVLALGLVSCGGKDAEEVKKLSSADSKDLTTEQIATGIDWYMEYQEEAIAALEEKIANVEEDLVEGKASSFAYRVGMMAEVEDSEVAKSEAYKDNADKIKENKQKIEQLQEELDKAKEEAAKKLGFE